MTKLKTYTLDEVKDEMIGKVGSKARDEYESKLKEDMNNNMVIKEWAEKIALPKKELCNKIRSLIKDFEKEYKCTLNLGYAKDEVFFNMPEDWDIFITKDVTTI